jgi:CheY-like chemotaxis protein
MPASKPRLLLAEDDGDLLEALAEILSGEGYEVVAASSPQQALEILDTQVFHGIVTDAFARSGQGPLELPAALAARARPTPVGVLSGWSVPGSEVVARGLRFALLKPFDISEMLGRIAEMLGEPLDPQKSPEARLARDYFRTLEEKDWLGLVALCAPGVTYVLPGGSKFSATLEGREALREHAEKTFAVFREAKFDDLTIYATPGGVAARYLGSWSIPGGGRSRQAGTAILQIEGGQIQRVGVEMNQTLLERLAPA